MSIDSNWLEELELYNSLDDSIDIDIEMIARSMEKSKNVTVLTGAGISVESGIPDFRSSNGLWKRYDPSVYGSYSNFKKHPELFWKMTEEIHKITAYPNHVHEALAELEKIGVVKTIVTQNVDGLHQQAGSKNVVEMHGSGRACYCIDCDYISRADDDIWSKPVPPSQCIPRCPKCGGLLKLDVVLFGEKLDRVTYDEVVEASTKTDFLLVIGTSLQVAPCNIIPFRAKHCGAQVAFINCSKTPMDEYADFVVRGDLKEIVPKIANKIKEIREKRFNGLRRAWLLSYSFAIVIVTMLVTFYNNVFHQNLKISTLDNIDGTETPVVSEYEPTLRRHSIPLEECGFE
ncbi:Sir2 family transcriptional regulator, putative [Entamoeba histolytica HM-3:IMSS]|uniref:Sir2 family transcriptional regulator, putative n=6 Tax=Entamoeba histolytica TaxID=5759 RepID=C4LYC2_ENTH1|nr:Sir2 family transcriptional regulator, putative [Entamoeba histolytica HM-1:IMSS]EMD45920.1 Sir2 family transcriptional regulator, putative [Entamoeba histolytica KU27]EMS15151.1 Sir2 family transcriptional regulator, putative [Entamoeba histolytica HM-3:IMSS]ENY62509.1 Sir2 family transcriptional regulator, putative [Entamoeba histolytica HM-1:IMSS-A]GAT93809.1 sir2 family transcriptional regulator putative [Entamoeba histolytica]EAL49420.2 Sir2 family transcriptional regulator, putative [|eukprot:XP_654806.2 Sir2 family transcriptional regulator, putative [Entamoeba histolytica HM-1:IMSS]